MTQIAAETLGLPVEDVTFKLGDSSLPMSPLEGGSWPVSSVGSAVKAACEKVRERLFELARKVKDSPLAKVRLEEVSFAGGHIRAKEDSSREVSITAAMRHGEVLSLEEQTVSLHDKHKQSAYTLCTHSAVFVEVKVHEDFGTVKVTRVVSAIAGGRVLNPKTARSQILSGSSAWHWKKSRCWIRSSAGS